MAGAITSNGFKGKSFQQCRDDLVAIFRDVWHDINTDSASPSGQLIDVLSIQEAYLWQAIQEVYMSSSPSTATDMSLDFLADQKNLTRFQHQIASAQILIYYISAEDIDLETGFEIASEREGWIFQTTSNYVMNKQDVSKMFIQANADFTNERLFQLDDNLSLISFYEENELEALNHLKDEMERRGYNCVVHSAETSPAIDFDFNGKPTLEITSNSPVSFLDNTWAGFSHLILAKSINVFRNNPTPDAIDIGRLNRIMKPVDAILKAYNPEVSFRGRLRETNSELRERMSKQQINGLATFDALEFNLLYGVSDVAFVRLSRHLNTPFGENHAPNNYIHILVEGGNDSEIISTIARVKAAGIPTLKTSEDSIGGYYEPTREEIWFDRPVNIDIELIVRFTYNLNEATILNYENIIAKNFIDFLQNLNKTMPRLLVANKFLQVLYSYPGFGSSWCSVRKKGETEWQKEIAVEENKRLVLGINDIFWERREE
jgi:hypothetical protein